MRCGEQVGTIYVILPNYVFGGRFQKQGGPGTQINNSKYRRTVRDRVRGCATKKSTPEVFHLRRQKTAQRSYEAGAPRGGAAGKAVGAHGDAIHVNCPGIMSNDCSTVGK